MKRLYVGQLPFRATDDDLKSAFEKFGAVEDVRVITDRETGRSKGFGFVTFSSKEDACKAIDGLNAQIFPDDNSERKLVVNWAEDKPRDRIPYGREGDFSDRSSERNYNR